MSHFIQKLKDLKINVKQDGFSKTFNNFENEWLPSNKIILTLVWIFISFIFGELIIYAYQNIYSTNISQVLISNYKENLFKSKERENYNDMMNSKSKLYLNILSRYTNENNDEVKQLVNNTQNETNIQLNNNLVNNSNPSINNNIEQNQKSCSTIIDNKCKDEKNIMIERLASENKNFIIHKVKAGETLTSISRKYYNNNNKYKEIMKYNNLKNANSIKPGDKLIIVLN